MGQQQLIIAILVIVIVGVATVIAISKFNESADNSNVESVRQDVLAFATLAQGYLMKNEMFGGGGGDFEGITFRKTGFPADQYGGSDLSALNANGIYYINEPEASDTTFVISAHPASRVEGVISVSSTATVGEGFLEAEIGLHGIVWIDNQ